MEFSAHFDTNRPTSTWNVRRRGGVHHDPGRIEPLPGSTQDERSPDVATLIGYARVSTAEQDLSIQIARLKTGGEHDSCKIPDSRYKCAETHRARSFVTRWFSQRFWHSFSRCLSGFYPPGRPRRSSCQKYKQPPENLSRKGFVPIRGSPRRVTEDGYISVVVYCWRPSDADPQTALSR